MTPERFCDWLQGYVELDGSLPDEKKWEIIKDHLSLVFTKVTPDRDEDVTDNKLDKKLSLKELATEEDFDEIFPSPSSPPPMQHGYTKPTNPLKPEQGSDVIWC